MSLPEFDVSGQKVLVVGAGRGIGKGIALAFAEAGADVAISALGPTGVNQVAEEIKALGREALPVTGDATKAADMDRVAQQVLDKFGHVDTLVNCVGATEPDVVFSMRPPRMPSGQKKMPGERRPP